MVYIKFPNNCLCFSPDCKRPKTNIHYHVMSQAITVSKTAFFLWVNAFAYKSK